MTEKLRVLIADDERPAREFLKRLIQNFEDVELVGEAEDGSEALEKIGKLEPDLAVLDLQMPEMSGIEVVKKLRRAAMPLVAFITAFDEYAVQAFELNAVDYLLKPVDKLRFRETIDRAAARLENIDARTSENSHLENAVAYYERSVNNEPIERIPVRVKEDILFVQAADVVSVVADGELLRITTIDNSRYTINFRLKDLEARMDGRKFVRLSRSAIINLDHVSRVSPLPGGTYLIVLENGQELAASRTQSKALKANLLKL